MKHRGVLVGVGVVVVAMAVVAVLVARSDQDTEPDEQVATGQGPSSTVPSDEDAFVVDDFLARPVVTGMGDDFVLVRGGRRPTLSVLDPSGETIAEVAVPVAGGTGLANSLARAITDDQVLVTGVQCSTVRGENEVGTLCDPGDGFVATFAVDSQEWAVVPGPVDPGPLQDLRPLGVHDGRAVVQAYEDLLTIDLATGATDPVPEGGGPTEGSGVRCLAGDLLVRGDTYSSPFMRRPEPGEYNSFGDEPFPPFGASTFDLTTRTWGTFVPAPDQYPFDDSFFTLNCVGDDVVALPSQPLTNGAGDPTTPMAVGTVSPSTSVAPAPAKPPPPRPTSPSSPTTTPSSSRS